MPRIQVIENGSITSTPGFEAAGVAAGLKNSGALDFALVYSAKPCVASAVFTTNLFKAAPVLYDQNVLARNRSALRGVVINSGCANACTGEQGLRDAKAMASTAASALGLKDNEIMVMSTGVIGMSLLMDKIENGVRKAVAQRATDVEAGHAAALAIMTTDTRPKEVAIKATSDIGEFTIAGMAKGAGMIHPNMATMLSVITSDVAITPELAQQALGEAVKVSYNMITVDGDTSTNDTLLLMANGLAEMEPITSPASKGYRDFTDALRYVATELAKGLVRDGEGATHFIEITVEDARTWEEAKRVAKSVANSALVKTAIYGQDANWGRIICAVGYSGVDIDPSLVSVWLGELQLVRSGAPYDVNEERASEILAQSDINIRIALGQGDAQATVWTCDFSHQYVDINARYRT